MREDDSFDFDLFISYSTDPDFALARRIESFLETFHRLPNPNGVKLKQLRVCRDGSDFHTGGAAGTTSTIEQYLSRSRELLVLCSKRARSSKWVDEEICWCLDHERPIRVAITEGERLGSLQKEVFPPALIDAGLHTAIGYDFREHRGRTAAGWESVRPFDDEMARLAADLNNLPVGEVQPIWFAEQRKRSRRSVRIASGVAAAMLLLAGFALFQWQRAVQETERTRQQLYVAGTGLAERAWDEGSVDIVKTSLSGLVPRDGQRDLRDFEWFHLWRRAATEVRRLHVPGVALSTAAVSPDRRMLALGGRKWGEQGNLWNVVYLFSLANGELIRRLEGHTDAIQALAFHPSKPLLLSASDLEILAWDMRTWKATRPIQWGADHLVYSADGGTLAVSSTGTIRIFGDGFRKQAQLMVSDTVLGEPALSPDGAQLVVGDMDGKVYLFETKEAGESRVLGEHDGRVTAACWLAGKDHVATGATGDQTVKLWPLRPGKEPVVLSQDGPVGSLALSPDGSTLAVGFGDPLDLESGRAVALWHHPSVTERVILRGPARRVEDLVFTQDGKLLIGATEEEDAHVWDVSSALFRDVLPAPEGRVWEIDFSRDGRMLAAAEASGSVALWDLAERRVTRQAAVHSWRTLDIAIRPQTGEVVSSGQDLTIRLWQPGLASHRVLDVAKMLFTDLRFSPDGGTLAVSNCNGALDLWDASRWSKLDTFKVDSCLSFVAWSPDGKTLATGGGDPANAEAPRSVFLWRPGESSHLELEGAQTWARSGAFSTDGKLLATGHWNGDVIVWDLRTRKPRWTLKGHQEMASAVVFSSKRNVLVSGGNDGTVRFWDLTTGQQRAAFADGPKPIHDLDFRPGGDALAAAGEPGIVLWLAAETQ